MVLKALAGETIQIDIEKSEVVVGEEKYRIINRTIT